MHFCRSARTVAAMLCSCMYVHVYVCLFGIFNLGIVKGSAAKFSRYNICAVISLSSSKKFPTFKDAKKIAGCLDPSSQKSDGEKSVKRVDRIFAFTSLFI